MLEWGGGDNVDDVPGVAGVAAGGVVSLPSSSKSFILILSSEVYNFISRFSSVFSMIPVVPRNLPQSSEIKNRVVLSFARTYKA